MATATRTKKKTTAKRPSNGASGRTPNTKIARTETNDRMSTNGQGKEKDRNSGGRGKNTDNQLTAEVEDANMSTAVISPVPVPRNEVSAVYFSPQRKDVKDIMSNDGMTRNHHYESREVKRAMKYKKTEMGGGGR